MLLTILAGVDGAMSIAELGHSLTTTFEVVVGYEMLYRSLVILEHRGQVSKRQSDTDTAHWQFRNGVPAGKATSLEVARTLPPGLRTASDCINILRLDGTLLYRNRRGCLAPELPEQKTKVGRPWIEMLPDSFREAGRRALEEAGAGIRAGFTAITADADGLPVYWHNTLLPLENDYGAVHEVLCFSYDVTADLSPHHRRPGRAAKIVHEGGPTAVEPLVDADVTASWWQQSEQPFIQESFADRLNRLFALVRAPGQDCYQNVELIRALSEKELNLSAPYLTQLRSGDRSCPSDALVAGIAEFFGVRTVYFGRPLDERDWQYLIRLRNDFKWLELVHSPRARELTSVFLEAPAGRQAELFGILDRQTG